MLIVLSSHLFFQRLIRMNVGLLSRSFNWSKIKTLQCTLHPRGPNLDQTWHFPMAHLTCPFCCPRLRNPATARKILPFGFFPFFESFRESYMLECKGKSVQRQQRRQHNTLIRLHVLVMIRVHGCILHTANGATRQQYCQSDAWNRLYHLWWLHHVCLCVCVCFQTPYVCGSQCCECAKPSCRVTPG